MTKVSKTELLKVPKYPKGGRMQYLLERGYTITAARALVESLRGINRDAEGKIVRSKEWIAERIEYLEKKREEYKHRDAKLVEMIKQLKADLTDEEA